MSLKGKVLLIGLGIGVGYILGAKAGRERYDQIAKAASVVWNAPIVKAGRDSASGFVDDRLDDLAGLMKKGTSKVIDRVTGGSQRAKHAAVSPAPTESL